MFRHKGKTRTIAHNLKIASLLSLVAGIVNVVGFLAVQKLTTNVTGHFAFLIEDVFEGKFREGLTYLLFILSFLMGSFFSNISIELMTRHHDRLIYRIPIMFESLILFSVAFFGQILVVVNPNVIAYLLLFAMGLQNSLVTKISNSTVRTTHLTGLFTDLGIELSQLFFYKLKEQRDTLYISIKLRLTIISFFFLGGIVGGIFYSIMQFYVLALAGILLLIGLLYDHLIISLLRRSRGAMQRFSTTVLYISNVLASLRSFRR